MYGRENLKTYTSSELYDRNSRKFEIGEAFLKEDADKVMDAMETRIKELEVKINDKEQCCKWCSNDSRIAGLNKRIAELESQLPKWISVKDRLPEENKKVLVSNPSAHTSKIAWKYRGQWFFDTNFDILEPTHWMPLLSVPTTEEK